MHTPNPRLPTTYIPHGGGPCFFMEWSMGPANTWDGMKAFLQGLAANLPCRPKAILVISAHWESAPVLINAAAQPSLLYDYYGFPPHTYALRYPVAGDVVMAATIAQALDESGIDHRIESERGLDHGVFIPFMLIYPNADIPIVQVSLHASLDAQLHLQIGQALESLRDAGVWIVGSGMSYHNLSRFGPTATEPARQFDDWLTEAVGYSDVSERHRALASWRQAPFARSVHPREEHLIPLMVVAGAAGSDPGHTIYQEQVLGATVSAFQFGS